ncbi:hypothetical protein BDZ97DRAFT_1817203, partial [Flammula alnicola]
MSSTSSPEPAVSDSGIDRIYSGETDESPFGSNLVTPTDEETYPHQGIHQRFDIANTILGYFASKDVSEEPGKTRQISQSDTAEVQDIDHADALNDVNEQDIDMGPSLPTTLDSTDTIASPVLTSSSLDSILRPTAGTIYNLPNDHIMIQRDEGKPLLDSDSIPVIRQPNLGTSFWAKELEPMISSLTFRALISIAFRLVCFLPWCVAVGGALILSPDHLEYIAFGPGYIEPQSGIRRYSHWAEYGFQHVVAFLAFIGAVVWLFPTLGLLIIGGLLAQFCWAWHSFL